MEPAKAVRVLFPLNIPSGTAYCGTAFGAIERPVNNNTSWESARDEVPAQGWIDISNNGYGAALISTVKYGYRVKDRILDLCLLRSVPYPGSELLNQGYTDLGNHVFSYSLFIHKGDYGSGRVVNESSELSVPPQIIIRKDCLIRSDLSDSYFTLDDPGVVVSAVKPSESGSGIILRLYESRGRSSSTFLNVHSLIIKRYGSVYEVNLMEEIEGEVSLTDNKIKVSINPYEIKTFMFKDRLKNR